MNHQPLPWDQCRSLIQEHTLFQFFEQCWKLGKGTGYIGYYDMFYNWDVA